MDISLTELVSVLGIRNRIYAQDLVLAAIARLDLLTVMVEEPGTLDELCRHNDISRRSGDVLCTLLRSMGLLETGETLRPTALARSCLVRDAPYDLRPYLASASSRATCLAAAELLRTGMPVEGGGVVHDSDDHGASSWAADVLAPVLASRLADVPFQAVLQIGGSWVAARTLVQGRGDPLVCEDDSIGPVPSGYDLHLFTHILHQRNASDVHKALVRSFDALPPLGWIVDYDLHLNADKSGPMSAAEYSAVLLSTSEGQCWSEVEIAGFLGEAGFVNLEVRETAADRSAIIAQKPATT